MKEVFVAVRVGTTNDSWMTSNPVLCVLDTDEETARKILASENHCVPCGKSDLCLFKDPSGVLYQLTKVRLWEPVTIS